MFGAGLESIWKSETLWDAIKTFSPCLEGDKFAMVIHTMNCLVSCAWVSPCRDLWAPSKRESDHNIHSGWKTKANGVEQGASHIWQYRYLLDFAKPMPICLLSSALCCWHICTGLSAHLGQRAGAHTTTASISALSGLPGAGVLVASPCVEASGWEHTTVSAQPLLPFSMLSRAEKRGAGMQLRSTLLGSWA